MMRGFLALTGYLWRRKAVVISVVSSTLLVIVLAWWWTGFSLSDIPLWGWVALLVGFITLPYALFIAAIVVSLIYNPDRIILHEVDPEVGDVAVHEISPTTYEELVVVDANGKEIGKAFLHSIDIKRSREAYEVADYNHETNVAEVSWMGEATNREIRRHQSMLSKVRKSLSPLARAYSDLHARVDLEIEDKVADSMNAMLAMVEGVELPPGQKMHDQIASEAGKEQLDQLPDPEEQLDGIEAPSPEDVTNGGAENTPDTGGDAP